MMQKMITFLLSVVSFSLCQGDETDQSASLQTVSQVARHVSRPMGVPRRSDVCFSPRWPRKRPGGLPLEMAKHFHATRLDWVYLDATSAPFVQQAGTAGLSVYGTVNSNLPDKTDGKPTYEVGRARDLNGDRVLPAFMKDWGCYWGCANNPDFRRIWLDHAIMQLDAGAAGLQTDGPRLSDQAMLAFGGCYCKHCVSGFRQALEKHLSPEQQRSVGIKNVQTFDYAVKLRSDRDSTTVDKEDPLRRVKLQNLFKKFQQRSVLNFYKDVHARLEKHAGRNVPFSCNNTEGFRSYLHQVHDYAMLEAYPYKEGIPSFFYRETIGPFHQIGKSIISTFVSDDVAHTRRYIAQCYALGHHAIVPWDVYTGPKSPRVFGKPTDSADLYGFVRANAGWLDGFEEAAVIGRGIKETRYGETPPIHVRGGSRQIVAVVRARPDDPDAAIVIHLVEWAEQSEPFTVVLDPRRLLGDRPMRVRLLTPALYEEKTHSHAQEFGQFAKLSIEHELMTGRQTSIEIPPLRPWAMLVIEPIKDVKSGNWEPMVWAAPESYYSSRLRVHCESPYSDVPLHYSLGGGPPTAGSPRYEGPLDVEQDSTLLRVRPVARDSANHDEVLVETKVKFTKVKGHVPEKRPDAAKTISNLRLWLSADTLDSNRSDGDRITHWKAIVGPTAEANSIQLPSGERSSAPVLRNNRLNGHSVVEFRESSHHLALPGFAKRHLASKEFTLFMVSRSGDPQFGFSGNSMNGGGGSPRLYATRDGLLYGTNRPIRSGATPNECRINTYRLDKKEIHLWVNGRSRAKRIHENRVDSLGGGGHLAIPFWSGGEFHGGELAEIAIFDRALAETERQSIETYFAKKYGQLHSSKWRTSP